LYRCNPRTPLDLTPIPNPTKLSWEAEKRAKKIEDLYAKIGKGIEKLNDQAKHHVKRQRRLIFNLETWYGSI